MSDTNVGIGTAYDSPEDKEIERLTNQLTALRQKLSAVEVERDALTLKWESDTPGKPGRMLRGLADTVARVTNSYGSSKPPSCWVEELASERDNALAELSETKRALAEETAILDWLEALLIHNGNISLRLWDHDGRRFLGHRELLIHRFLLRGGEDESLRAAIQSAMKENL